MNTSIFNASTSLLLTLFLLSYFQPMIKSTPVQVERDGDIILAGIFPIYLEHENICDLLLSYEGLVWSEAMIYAIHKINNDSNILNNITLGYTITDSCRHTLVAMKEALRLINHNEHILKSRQNQEECVVDKMNLTGSVLALIGAESSMITIVEANLVQLVDLPQVSYSATSDELSDDYYTSFFRTIPPDMYQSRAMVDLVRYFNWTYIGIVGEDDAYGRNGVYQFVHEAGAKEICIALEEYFPSVNPGYKLQQIVSKLKSLQTVRVVVVYAARQSAFRFFEEAERQNLIGKIWIGTDGWSDMGFLFNDDTISPLFQGMIGFLPHGTSLSGFSDYLNKLTPQTTKYGWWSNFWAREFNCSSENHGAFPKCTNKERITTEIYQEKLSSSKTSFVIDAVNALADILDKMKINACNNSTCVSLSNIIPADVLVAMRSEYKTEFIHYHSKQEQYKRPLYTLTNLQKIRNSTQAVQIGTWSDQSGLHLHDVPLIWPGGETNIPVSRCSTKCPPGSWQTTTMNCCWECISCDKTSISTSHGATKCTPCPEFYRPNEMKTQCVQMPKFSYYWTDMTVLCAISVHIPSVIGTIFIFIMMYKLRFTNLVAECGINLDVGLLGSILLCFFISPIHFFNPTLFTCSLEVCYVCTVYTLTVSFIFAKLLLQYPNTYISNKLLITFSLFFQFFMTTLWINADQPEPFDFLLAKERIYTECRLVSNIIGNICRILSTTYLISLSIACAILAFKTRHSTKYFSEARHIAYSMYSLLLNLALAYPVSVLVHGWFMPLFLSSMNLLASSSILGFLYGPKLYLVLRHRHRVRERSVSSVECIPEITVTRSRSNKKKPDVDVDKQKSKIVQLSVPDLRNSYGMDNADFSE